MLLKKSSEVVVHVPVFEGDCGIEVGEKLQILFSSVLCNNKIVNVRMLAYHQVKLINM
jgi:hypothetical protein